MSVIASTSNRDSALSDIWLRKVQEYGKVEDVDWGIERLIAHVRGQSLTLDQQEALQSFTPPQKAIIAAKAGTTLSLEVQGLINNEFEKFYSSTQLNDNAADTLTRISGVYTRWTDCLNLLGNGTPSSLPSWFRVKIEGFSRTIEKGIYEELLSCRPSNSYHSSMRAMGLESQWIVYVNRAARLLALEQVRAVEQEMEFEEAALTKLLLWLRESLLSTLHHWQIEDIDGIESRIEYELCVQLGQIRARQLFDIITDFPRSLPALRDLNICSDQSNLQPYTSRQLSQSLQARLLHPGASTRDIIQFYTHLIPALRYIDPSGVILSHVIGPVRTYLRARPDTISVIVASLLGQAGDFTLLRDMMRETGEAQSLGGADTSIAVYDDEDDGGGQSIAVNSMAADESARMVVIPSADEQDWAPRPIDAGPDYRQSRKSDVIAIIVSIFDDEEGFVAALEKSCAEQLVKVQGYDTTKEYETNENLKKRFGDAPLSRCDVMLNDVKRSQRYDRSIQSLSQSHELQQSQACRALHPLILSRQFWPPVKEATPVPAQQSASSMFGSATASSSLSGGNSAFSEKSVKMPGQFARALDQYQEAFKSLAPMRRLRWLNVRSSVKLELEMNDGRRIKDTVTPLQAAVVEVAAGMSASQLQPMSISLLVTELEVSKELALEAVYYWTGRGVLKAIDSDSMAFEVVEEARQG